MGLQESCCAGEEGYLRFCFSLFSFSTYLEVLTKEKEREERLLFLAWWGYVNPHHEWLLVCKLLRSLNFSTDLFRT